MRRAHMAVVARTVRDGVSRRVVMRSGLGVLAALARSRLVATPASESALPAHHTVPDETARDVCYRLCTSDATQLLTPERAQRCWTGCDLWAGDDEFI